jgi:hypothetical protein
MDQERTEALKSALEDATYNELVAAMIAAQVHHRTIKDQQSEAWDAVCVITRQIIPERFERDQIQNITVILPDGTKKQLLVIPQVSVKTPAENKSALWEWLREHDAEALITETVNSSTLAAYVRSQMKAGEAYPNDLCEVSLYDVASLRKA